MEVLMQGSAEEVDRALTQGVFAVNELLEATEELWCGEAEFCTGCWSSQVRRTPLGTVVEARLLSWDTREREMLLKRDVVALLLSRRADVNLACYDSRKYEGGSGTDGDIVWTPIERAVQAQHYRQDVDEGVIRLLLGAGAAVDDRTARKLMAFQERGHDITPANSWLKTFGFRKWLPPQLEQRIIHTVLLARAFGLDRDATRELLKWLDAAEKAGN